MASCRELEPRITAYVDGECADIDRGEVEAHLQKCPPCRAKAATERAAHELLRARCRDLRGCAPESLRARCAAQRARAKRPAILSRRWVPLSLAASLVLAFGVFLLFGWGSSVETYAAQLAADHVKCFQFNSAVSTADAETLGREWQSAQGWPLRVAASSVEEGLQLIGLRRCGSTRGRVAHLLYRWRGQSMSVYVLNGEVPDDAAGGAPVARYALTKFGEQEIIWTARGRTYAVVARAPLSDVEQMADYIRPRIE